ncbi:hypothetical protein N7G274_010070 [Stereocaulon virgatum]|uniref:Phosphoglycerate mutase-like protein n=1 Tax=Stereocaulon virgatum TaxID=373712 RepID=A0ABR3ZUE5_9LECA
MKLFLIRHGETVDNVAQLYAGVKDSALTNHGNLQAERLGKFLTKNALHFSHVFSSDLQRAHKTASAICSWANAVNGGRLKVTALKVLREQDFGFYEGKPFYARPRDSNRSGKDSHRSQHQDDPDFKDVESKESMDARMNIFLREHLVPLLRNEKREKKEAVAIVSHGIILSHLWRCFLKLLPKTSVTLSPGLYVGTGGVRPLENLGGWSNTAYLELDMQNNRPESNTAAQASRSSPRSSETRSNDTGSMPMLHEHQVIIRTVNGKEHLQGLKRTRGVGSSKYDESQKSIDSFFKKQKVG